MKSRKRTDTQRGKKERKNIKNPAKPDIFTPHNYCHCRALETSTADSLKGSVIPLLQSNFIILLAASSVETSNFPLAASNGMEKRAAMELRISTEVRRLVGHQKN